MAASCGLYKFYNFSFPLIFNNFAFIYNKVDIVHNWLLIMWLNFEKHCTLDIAVNCDVKHNDIKSER